MNLESWARQKFPMIRDVKYRWSGQVQEPSDYLAYIGVAPTSGTVTRGIQTPAAPPRPARTPRPTCHQGS